jgi:transcriptional regulator with XRE-family HTH domain
MMKEQERTAANFKRLRNMKGWTIMRTAEIAGLSYGYVGHIEMGKTGIGKRARKKWAQIFGVDESEFYREIPGEKGQRPEFDLLIMECQRLSEDQAHKLRMMIPIIAGQELSDLADADQIKKANEYQAKGKDRGRDVSLEFHNSKAKSVTPSRSGSKSKSA